MKCLQENRGQRAPRTPQSRKPKQEMVIYLDIVVIKRSMFWTGFEDPPYNNDPAFQESLWCLLPGFAQVTELTPGKTLQPRFSGLLK